MKIGFIDYYLDEWHANNYPQLFKDASDGEIEVAIAYGQIPSPITGMTSEAWCEKFGVKLAASIEEVVEQSDAIVVLSPDTPEQHPALCKLPLASGKRVYVDKTFATSKKIAEEIFENAEKHNTPCFSSSALRFSTEIKAADKKGIDFISARGPGLFSNYAIHQVEPIVTLMGSEVRRVMGIGTEKNPGLAIDYKDGRRAVMNTLGGGPFDFLVKYEDGRSLHIPDCSNYFPNFITDLVDFFRTGDVKVAHAETIAIMGILEKGACAIKEPGKWFDIE
ncbi:MAG: Gfo/Idh/MocA family oxidoreductase [Clostridia bacterium]|nr:Gfo/Idh/MocA family oxidoreductase [Clostridia bacterium]